MPWLLVPILHRLYGIQFVLNSCDAGGACGLMVGKVINQPVHPPLPAGYVDTAPGVPDVPHGCVCLDPRRLTAGGTPDRLPVVRAGGLQLLVRPQGCSIPINCHGKAFHKSVEWTQACPTLHALLPSLG